MSAKLIDSDGNEHLLTDDKPTVIGRLQQRCQIVIAHESVSREHAKIFKRGATFTIADLNSANGTFVNGKRVTRHDLASGDAVTLGQVTLGFAVGADRENDDSIALETDREPGPLPNHASAVQVVAAAAPAAIDPFADDPDVAQAEVSWQGRESARPVQGVPTIKQRDEVLQFNVKPRARGGLLREDLAQRPLWFQALLVLVALTLASALFVGVRSAAGKFFGTPEETSEEAQ